MTRPLHRLAAALALLAAAGVGTAQRTTQSFQTADGTRFLLVADPFVPHVHWAIASSLATAFEPAGFEGLAWTTMRVSLNGTWVTGSLDVPREREALAKLDDAWQRITRNAHDPGITETVRAADEAARALADLTVFPRVLAAAPTHFPAVVQRGEAGVLVLTTLPSSIGEVGRLLVERRDEQPLRELPRAWLQTFSERTLANALDSRQVIRGEVLALTVPGHPMTRSFAPPNSSAPTRAQALTTWAATQYPERTVHVLLGDFDPAQVRKILEATFQRTTLPTTTPPSTPLPMPLAGTRRSTVNGTPTPMVALAWVMPEVSDRFVLATALRWLADGPDSLIAQELQRQGRTTSTVQGLAPWPPAVSGRSLFLIEVSDPADVNGLTDLCLKICREAPAKAASADLQPATNSLQSRWREANSSPRDLAIELAVTGLIWPNRPVVIDWPEQVDPNAVKALLEQLFAGQPVIVEGRP